VLERRFTKFSEITQCNSHYAVQGHSRSPILVPFESSYTTSYQWLILIYILSCTVCKLWLIIVKVSLARGECLTLTLSLVWSPANIAINTKSLKTRFFGLHFCCRKYWCIFNHFYVGLIRPEDYRLLWKYAAVRAITPFKVIQGHECGTNRKPICDFLLVINTNLAPILHRFRERSIGPKSLYSATPLVFNTPDGGVPLGRSP